MFGIFKKKSKSYSIPKIGDYLDEESLKKLRESFRIEYSKPRYYLSPDIIQVYTLTDLIFLRDRNIITEDEFKTLARNVIGLDHKTE